MTVAEGARQKAEGNRAFSLQPSAFCVHLPVFEGSLAELASALRAGQVMPSEVPLLRLTREVLAWVQAVTGENAAVFADHHPDLLPTLANVIALKARLLLPQPEPEDVPDDFVDELLEEVVEGVEALAELDSLVAFLAARREERAGLIPARPVPVELPRRERKRNPQGSLAKLVKAAQSAVRQVDVPLLARERLTLADALARVDGGPEVLLRLDERRRLQRRPGGSAGRHWARAGHRAGPRSRPGDWRSCPAGAPCRGSRRG